MITLQYIAIAIIVTIAATWAIRRIIRAFRKPSSACDGCDLATSCRKKPIKSRCNTSKNTPHHQ